MTQKDHKEFECKRCGRCCRELIGGSEIEVLDESREAWKKRPDLINHPLYDKDLEEFGSASVMIGLFTINEVKKDFKKIELLYELKHGEPIKFLWGGLVHDCPFLKKDDIYWSCLLHGDPAKPEACTDWPMRDEHSLEEARKIGCKSIELLEAEG